MEGSTEVVATVTSAPVTADIPLPTRIGILIVLIVSALYGVTYNTILLLTIGYFRKLQNSTNKLVFFLASIDLFNSLIVTALLAYRLLGWVESRLHSVCMAFAAGVLFTNIANMLIITSLAVVRHQMLCTRKMTRTMLYVVMVCITLVSLAISVYYIKQGGVLVQVCEQPYEDVQLGSNRLFYILALPFLSSIGISVTSYCRIHHITKTNANQANQPSPDLLKAMVLVFGVYVISFLPILLLAVLRKIFGMSVGMAHAHLWVAAFNCFGYAIGSSAYSLHSVKLRRAIRLLFHPSSIQPAS
ncbi:hypothetical protein CAPTEDRAFT_202434 [Capitella teleta]|uniref:G-protein coupled receptors family 1 profile domain-containing protein n=1 Tax=Capitella teleta TaxID=283909 RepID=R7U6C4_CAPTE|nr:hypothetical protein CAPTEDRAFT_202434 [Capitella teleta]|eukprot:ELT99231.1 hypothetical protein CAPTEDRAFT_202434 [Capitella teleta]